MDDSESGVGVLEREIITADAEHQSHSYIELIEASETPNWLELIANDAEATARREINDTFKRDPHTFRENWREISDIELRPNDAAEIVLAYLKGYRRDGEPLVKAADIPIYELHCPRVRGCSTLATVAIKKSRDVNLTIEFIGLKVGGSKKRTFSCKSTEPSTGSCYTIFIPAELAMQRWSAPKNPAAKSIYTLTGIDKFAGAYDSTRKLEIILGHHDCGWSFDHFFHNKEPKAGALRHLLIDKDVSTVHDGTGGEITTTAESTRKFTFPLDLSIPDFLAGGSSPLNVELSIESTIEKSFTLEHTLAGGYHFRAFAKLTDDGPVNWIWKRGTLETDDVF